MPFTTAHNPCVRYGINGHGPGLVLVHGIGGDAEKVFGNAVDPFASTSTVIRPNFSGSGQTEDDGGALSMDWFADPTGLVKLTRDFLDA